MAWRLVINVGFVTNSSTAIYHIPRVVLDDSEVQAFLAAYEISDGYIGKDLQSRSAAESLLITREQKRIADGIFRGADGENASQGYNSCYPNIDSDDDKRIVVIFGDEYTSITSHLVQIMDNAIERINKLKGLELTVTRDEYH